MKRKRQEKLLELISRYEIDTQDELIARLRENGFDVTQATVSRDIRELKISKMTTGKGTYRYVLPKQTETAGAAKFNSAMIDSVISVANAGNLVVIKTYAGLANAVAVGIDSMNIPEILGCVAGDDAILIAVRDTDAAEQIADQLNSLVRNI